MTKLLIQLKLQKTKLQQIDVKKDVQIFFCEPHLLTAKDKVRQALASLEKTIGTKVAMPVHPRDKSDRNDCFISLPQTTYQNHIGFKMNLKSDKAEEFLELIRSGALNSWNVIELRQHQTNYSAVPRNSCHRKCDLKHL